MIVEIRTQWPFFRRHTCPKAPDIPVLVGGVLRGPGKFGLSDSAHRTWVVVPGRGRGYLDHHDPHGWWVCLDDGGVVQTNDFTHV